MRKNPSYTALLGPTCLLISEKSDTYTINWSYTIIWQVSVSSCFAYCVISCIFQWPFPIEGGKEFATRR